LHSRRKRVRVRNSARATGDVSTVPVYCVPVYCPTCLGTKGLKRTLVRVHVRSTVPVYALLYVGFGQLSYVSRKPQLLRNQFVEEEDDPRVGGQWRIATLSRRGKCSPAAGFVLYVQKSVRNLQHTPD
jgi:hypothetical protein